MRLQDAMIYHVYPLGLCGAPARNDFSAEPVPRLEVIHAWLDHIQALGMNAIYFGPLFESTAHGYDTADYFQVDRRLGTNETFKRLAQAMKARGLNLILDGVFHHVGRDFWAFKDVQENGAQSAYRDWFAGLDFSRRSPYGDGFAYEGWAGHYDLVKLNLENADVRQHLFDAVSMWIREFDIDGLRLDAADKMSLEFFRALREHCHAQKPDFWLMGEVVHGDYSRWANPDLLDSVTNYEAYKGLYSSHNDCNYFEIAYSLNRQFGAEGIYRNLLLYSFADNHDVDRVASSLRNSAHLYTLYGLLFTMPGIPSIYYGSEWGISGKRTATSDSALRPTLDLSGDYPHPQLEDAIQKFASIRRHSPALKIGGYQQLHIAHEQFAFARTHPDQTVIVAVNASSTQCDLHLDNIKGVRLRDVLNDGEVFDVQNGHVTLPLYGHWLRILELQSTL